MGSDDRSEWESIVKSKDAMIEELRTLLAPVPCGWNRHGIKYEAVGCGREIHYPKDVYRCVDCNTPFHRDCLHKHCESELAQATAWRRWRCDKPTQPGWYWWRDLRNVELRWIFKVEQHPDTDAWCYREGHDLVEVEELVRGEWAGPIPEGVEG